MHAMGNLRSGHLTCSHISFISKYMSLQNSMNFGLPSIFLTLFVDSLSFCTLFFTCDFTHQSFFPPFAPTLFSIYIYIYIYLYLYFFCKDLRKWNVSFIRI